MIVVESDSAFTPAQLGEAAALKGKLEALQAGSTVIGPIPSEDAKAVQFVVPIASSAEVKTVVKELRNEVQASAPAGMQTFVTGPAGLTADLVSAFAGIDGILLLVALGAVFLILLIVYRSLLLPVMVLFTSVFALCAAILLVFGMAKAGWIQLNGQSQGILSILVIGAATDYALLYVARFREALTHTTNRTAAAVTAWKAAWEPILASGATVIIALLCLLFSDLNSNKALGPVAAAGILCALFAALTLLPALMALLGRAAFWPFRPKLLPETEREPELVTGLEGQKGLWRATGSLVSRRPRTVWVASVLLLLVAGTGLLQLKANGVAQTDVILTASNAVDGQDALGRHFDAGSGSPAVIVADEAKAQDVLAKLKASDGVGDAYLLAEGGAPVITGAPARAGSAPGSQGREGPDQRDAELRRGLRRGRKRRGVAPPGTEEDRQRRAGRRCDGHGPGHQHHRPARPRHHHPGGPGRHPGHPHAAAALGARAGPAGRLRGPVLRARRWASPPSCSTTSSASRARTRRCPCSASSSSWHWASTTTSS